MAHDEKDDEAKLAERKFMHDLATPIAVASGQLEVMLDLELSSEPLTAAQRVRIEKAKKAIDRIRDMLIVRRKILVEQSPMPVIVNGELVKRKAG